ncbi:protein FAM149A-like isoform X2 [Dysidea avara]|uniref:protein FAM149A-like isoform X2 n=1 Tax=Dysidea avara TaxID=196820 RepID=UPI003319735E
MTYVSLIIQDQMSKRKQNPSSLAGVRGHSVDIHSVNEQTPARLAANSFMQAKYLSSLEEAVGPDMDSAFAPSASYSITRDPVDSFSGYSSLLSWNNEDEFELEASTRVDGMFQDINSALFDHMSTGSRVLDHECDEWSTTYPHIRVNGVQILESEDEGTEYVAPDPFVVNRFLLEGLSLGQHDHTDQSQLCVRGHQIHPLPVPPTVAANMTSSSRKEKRSLICKKRTCQFVSHYVSTHVLLCCSVSLCVVCHVTVCVCVCHSSLAVGPYEELIASHGIVEEYFAFDATGDQLINSTRGRGHRTNKRQGLPPITPNACVRDTVGSQVFDLIWAEVVVILQPLLHAAQSRTTTTPPSPTLDAPSTLIGRSQVLQQYRPVGGATGPDSNLSALQDLMKIKPFPLQTRQPSLLARCHTSFASHDHIGSDTNDPLLLGNHDHYGLLRNNRYTPIPGSRPDTMATGRLISGGWNRRNMATLKPLDKPRTPANLHDDYGIDLVCLRGQKITSVNGTTPSWARSGQLPPLEDTVFDKRSPPPIRASTHKPRSSGLASRMTITGLENNSHSDIQQILCITSNDVPISLRSDTPKIPPPPSRRHPNQVSYGNSPLKMIGHTPGHYAPPLDEDDDIDDVTWGLSTKPQSTSSKHRLRGIIR